MLTSTPSARRRRAAVVAGAVATALLAAACGGEPAAAGVPEATALCGPVEFPALQFGSHLIGDAEPPIPYSSTPPTSGWHSSGAPPVGAFTAPVSEPQQVTTLEVGAVVITYGDLPAEDVELLSTTLGEALDDRVVLTPYDRLPPGQVALASWGALQRCDGVDVDAVNAYVTAFADPVDEAHVAPAD